MPYSKVHTTQFNPLISSVLGVLTLLFFCDATQARIWTSKTGNYEFEATQVAFNEEFVVLKRPTGALVAVELSELSDKDQEFVRSKETKESMKKSVDEMQTWTAKDGMKVTGRVVAFGRKEIVIQRKLGKVNINDKKFASIDPLHQKLILKIISKLENVKLEDEKQLEEWGKSLGGTPKSHTLEGVVMQLESGEEIGVPFFMFSDQDLAILKPGWDSWLEKDNSEKTRERENFLMRSAAIAHQQDKAAAQQVEMLKLGLLATASGVFDMWQVGLVPGPGVYGRQMMVMVPAQNSEAAIQIALQQNPGFVLFGVRRANNRR